jgi:hypothetical protein
MSAQRQDKMPGDSEPELVDHSQQGVELNSGIFIWPMILSAMMTIGLLFGYLLWGS